MVADMTTPHSIVRTVPARLWAAACLTGGTVLWVRPRRAVRWAAGPDRPPPTWLVRVLGTRELVQGMAIAVRPSRTLLLAGCLVDLLHAASMAAAAVVAPRYRRPAVVSGLLAAASSAVGAASAAAVLTPRSAP
jgi:hypothetical protein